MFAFHETTRKRICRTAFVLLCLVPTVATAAWIVDRRLPSHAAAQAARVGAFLQVQVELAGYREPRPNSIRCDAVTLADGAAGGALVRLQGIRLVNLGGTYSITADGATIEPRQVAVLASKLASWLASSEALAADIQIGRIAIDVVGREVVLGAAKARLDRDSSGAARLRVVIRALNSSPDEKPSVQVVVERSATKPDATTVAILEAFTPLPAAALAGVPGLDAVDADANFAGVVRWTLNADGVTGAAKCRLDNVELGSVLPVGSPHVAIGRGAVTLTDFSWRQRRLERLVGALTVEMAEVSLSLLAAAVKHLYCVQASDGVNTTGSKLLIDVDRLACRFVLDRNGLTVTGDMPASDRLPAGCLATSGGVCLLMQPQYVDVPTGAWVQFVAGPANSWVPASAEAVKVAERLPLP
jgi:hypothetical protein